jgi:hypothetical protein
MSRLAIAVTVLLLFTVGCDQLFKATESESDRKAKTALAGVWFLTTEEPGKDDKAVTVHSWMRLRDNGVFTERVRELHPDGLIAEGGSDGEWLVTDGLFKLRFVAIDGQNLRRHDLHTMYAFKIVSVAEREFTFMDPLQPAKKPLTMKRVVDVGKEP